MPPALQGCNTNVAECELLFESRRWRAWIKIRPVQGFQGPLSAGAWCDSPSSGHNALVWCLSPQRFLVLGSAERRQAPDGPRGVRIVGHFPASEWLRTFGLQTG